ncbi:hypothetical protein FMUND_10252 [Fusarium mundagurra]|uniref:Uncharacterized protein n=1 Tax=Fusarium mundagurra TaxID=1567541 RepID=A0A8H6D9I5_9HYPO|nr:hypothetical protein FMUND_10252 [Fusarium mundagurra]
MHAVIVEVILQETSKASPLAWWLDVLFLGLLVAILILEFITLCEPPDRLFLCGLQYPVLPRLESMGVRCFSIAVMLVSVYWNAFRSIKLDNSLRYELENSTSKNTILRWIYSEGQREVDFRKYLEHKEKDKHQRIRKKAAILEQSPEFWKTFTMGDTAYSGRDGCLSADVKPLLTGQIMPMLLLIVIALTVVEVGTIKNFRRIEIEVEIKKTSRLIAQYYEGRPWIREERRAPEPGTVVQLAEQHDGCHRGFFNAKSP